MSVSNEQRAISIRHPWAYAILHLGKDIENRPMRTHYRGRILIQASLKVEEDEARELKLDPDELSTGAIVGSVEIVDCIRGSKSKWANRGQWHWVLKNPRVLAKPRRRRGGELMRIELSQAAPLGNMRGWVSARPLLQWSVVR